MINIRQENTHSQKHFICHTSRQPRFLLIKKEKGGAGGGRGVVIKSIKYTEYTILIIGNKWM